MDYSEITEKNLIDRLIFSDTQICLFKKLFYMIALYIKRTELQTELYVVCSVYSNHLI